MDLYPWPKGLGFKDAPTWWEYVHGHSENEKLDLLLTSALLNDEICQLLLDHDEMLLDAFQLSAQMIELLSTISADNLIIFTTILIEKNSVASGDDMKS